MRRGADESARAAETSAQRGEPLVRAAEPAGKRGEPSARGGEPLPRGGAKEPKRGEPEPRSGEPEPKRGEPSSKAGKPEGERGVTFWLDAHQRQGVTQDIPAPARKNPWPSPPECYTNPMHPPSTHSNHADHENADLSESPAIRLARVSSRMMGS